MPKQHHYEVLQGEKPIRDVDITRNNRLEARLVQRGGITVITFIDVNSGVTTVTIERTEQPGVVIAKWEYTPEEGDSEAKLSATFQDGIERGLPNPPRAYIGFHFKTVTITSPTGYEKMVVWDRDYWTSWDLEKALSFLQKFAIDGIEESWEVWVSSNEDKAAAYRKDAKSYYIYCRDVNQKMQKLLGDKAFSEYINL